MVAVVEVTLDLLRTRRFKRAAVLGNSHAAAGGEVRLRGRPSKVMGLPEELRNTLQRRLIEQGFHDYRTLAQWLRQQGHEISTSSLQRFGIRLARDLETTRLVAPPAHAMAKALPGGAGATTKGLMQLAQEKLISVLAEIHQLKQGDMSRLAHAVAHLTQAAISLQRWTDELDQRLGEREGAAPQARPKLHRGLSSETAQALRNALLGIAPFHTEQIGSQEAAADQHEASAPLTTRTADEFEKGEKTGRTASTAPFKKGNGFDNDSSE
jgi:hypothetical protein